MPQVKRLRRHDDATRELIAWARQDARLCGDADAGSEFGDEAFAAAQRLAAQLGARPLADRVQFGFWTPELRRASVRPGSLALEVFTPLEPIRYREAGRVTMAVERLPAEEEDGFVWLVASGLRLGSREVFGSFYWLRYETEAGETRFIRDPLATSLPYGVFAPAELYDAERLQRERADRAFFRRHGIAGSDEEAPRLEPPGNILQLHVGTATPSGTLGELADLYRALADKVRSGAEPTPAERNFLGYDALQLLPLEPQVEPPGADRFFLVEDQGDEARVRLRPPATSNWGYDVVIAGSAAVNPALLRSGRPDELVDLAAVLHTFPGKPIRLIFDLVFGHADDQALQLLPEEFFAGAGMYGRELAHRRPLVRALLLEMQRRKVDFGADGVRVDGAQDFRHRDPDSGEAHHDDAFLQEMSALVQRVADASYRPFMIFEDGRPWPRADWETASTYRDVIGDQPHAFQWGPLTFAHNTPCLEGFWDAKWWRVEQIAAHGSHWINGCANHDTLRRGYQIPTDAAVNRRLGDSLPEILRRSYDHPAASLLTYGLLPGVPMEFIAATMRSPWAFFRDTDPRHAVTVAAEEVGFLRWRTDPQRFAREDAFVRLKALGFERLDELHAFSEALARAVAADAAGAPLEPQRLAEALRDDPASRPLASAVGAFDGEALQRFADAFSADLRDHCLVWRFEDELDSAQVNFNRVLRDFRRNRPWLMRDFHAPDVLRRRRQDDGGTLVYGLRHSPDGSERVLLVANLEGEPVEFVPAHLDLPFEADERREAGEGWRVVAASPRLAASDDLDAPLRLADAEGVLYYWQD